MIVYHGTTFEVYKIIKGEGIIRAASSTNSPYVNIGDLKTTENYIYVTSKLNGTNSALDYATRNFRQRIQNSGNIKGMNEMPVEIVIIKLNIEDKFLEQDKDDEYVETSFRYKGDIQITNELAVEFRFSNYQKCCNYYDNLTDAQIDSWKWEKILS